MTDAQGVGQEAPADDVAADVAPETTETTETEATPSVETETPEAGGDDWRALASGGDEKLKGYLGRISSPEALAKKAKSFDDMVANGEMVPSLKDDATEAEIAAYRKATGIPDDVEDYFKTVDASSLSEVDQGLLKDFATQLHGNNMPPAALKQGLEFYNKLSALQEQDMAEVSQRQKNETEDALRQEWGKDYRNNVAVLDEWIAERWGSEAPELLSKPFADGTQLGNDPRFLKMAFDLAAREKGDLGIIISEDGAGQDGLQERIAAHRKLSREDPAAYNDPAYQAKVQRDYAMLEKMEAAKAARAGA